MGLGRSLFLNELDQEINRKNKLRSQELDSLVSQTLGSSPGQGDIFSGARGLIDAPAVSRVQDPIVEGPGLSALTAKEEGTKAAGGGDGSGLISTIIKLYLGGG